MDILLAIYTIGMVISVVVFYEGGVRGKAKNPEIFSLVFGCLWFITLPLLLASAIIELIRENK